MDIKQELKTFLVVCVVLPTYNEKDTIEEIIRCIVELQGEVLNFELKLLVVDDLSPDGTSEIVLNLMKKYKNLALIQGEKEGLGDAYKRGIQTAIYNLDADIIIQMDADGQHDPKMINKLLSLTSEYDVVVSSLPGLASTFSRSVSWRCC